MKTNKLNRFSLLLIAALFVSQSMFAEETKPLSEEQHIFVGERACSEQEKTEVKEKRARLLQKIELGQDITEEEVTLSDAEAKEISGEVEEKTSEMVSKAKQELYSTTHQGCFHSPIAISFLGDTLELEDGSIWGVYSGDRYKTLDWFSGDTLIIIANNDWFSSYDYKIVNLNTGAKIKVNLSLGPIYNGFYTHWIIAIDYFRNEIVLEDGSFWKMSSLDDSVFQKWLPNDTIIIGINDGWFSSSNPNMLINVNTNNHAIGKCIY